MKWNELFKKQLKLTKQNRFKLVVLDYNKWWYLDKVSNMDSFDGRSFELAMELQGDERITGWDHLQYVKIGMWNPWAPKQVFVNSNLIIKKISPSPLVAKKLGDSIINLSLWCIHFASGEKYYLCPAIDKSKIVLTDQTLTIMAEDLFIKIPHKTFLKKRTREASKIERGVREGEGPTRLFTTFYKNGIFDILSHNFGQGSGLRPVKGIKEKIRELWPPLKRPSIKFWKRGHYPHRAILPSIGFIVLFLLSFIIGLTGLVLFILNHFLKIDLSFLLYLI